MNNGFKKGISAIFIISSLVILLSGCGKKANNLKIARNQNIDVSVISEPTSLDVSKIADSVSFQLIDQTTEGLYKYNQNGKAIPALATKLNVSSDGKHYTIDIRHDSKWSNGDKVTANDFVYSWRRAVTPQTASQYTYLFLPIKNADLIAKGKLSPEKLGVTASGKYQLKINLSRPTPYFKLVLARETLYPINKRVVDKFGSKYGTQSKYTVSNGAFTSKGWTGNNNSWKLVKNNNYWDEKSVKASSIRYQVAKSPSTAYNLYQANKLDIVNLAGEQAAQLKDSKDAVKRQLASTKYLSFNQRKKTYQNKNIRIAISKVINREELTNKILKNGSTPATTFVPSGFAKSPKSGNDFASETKNLDMTDYNPKAARKYLKKGFNELGISKLDFKLMSTDDDQTKNIVEYLQTSIQKGLPGVKVSLQSVPAPTMISRATSGDFDVNYLGWSADFADPISFLSNLTTDSGVNWSKWSNKQFDKDIDKSNTIDSNNVDQRWEDLVNAGKILANNQGVVAIFKPNSVDLVKPELKNVTYDKINGHYDFTRAYLEK